MFKFFTFLVLALVISGCTTTVHYETPTGKIETNIWPELRDNFDLDHYEDMPEVQDQIRWFMRHKDYLYRVAMRGAPYIYYIRQEVNKSDIPGELVLLPIIESAYNPFNYSHSGAAGLWQFMPATASGFSVKQDWWYDGRRDIVASTQAALDYLKYLNQFFNGDWLLSIAAYNCGEGTVENAIHYNQLHGEPTDFWHLHLPQQTRTYVPELLALSAILSNPTRYPMQWPNTSDLPYFVVIKVDHQINLAEAAKMAGLSTQDLYELNPGFNRWASDPEGPQRIVIPADKEVQFKQALAELPNGSKVSWQHYTVHHGDTLNSIARHHNTNPKLIQVVNKLKTSYVRPGSALLVPVNQHELPSTVIGSVQNSLSNEKELPAARRVIHKIGSNDNLWVIAKAYHVSVSDIKKWNNLTNDSPLTPGSTLLIWTRDDPEYVQTYSSKLRPYLMYHVVTQGETLDGIAKKYHITPAHLEAANHLHNPVLKVGQRLVVPPLIKSLGKSPSLNRKVETVIVRPGDSIAKIAEKNHVKTSSLMQWNKLTDASVLHSGQKLVIYH